MNRVFIFLLLLSCFCSCICAFRLSTRPKKSRPKGTISTNSFQIKSSGYNKCLTVSFVRRRGVYRKNIFTGKTHRYFPTTSVALYLNDCAYLSAKQSWRWTSDGRLQSDLNQECLAVTGVWGYSGLRYGVSMQPCDSSSSYQRWVCNSGYLKLKKRNLYLVPFVYSGRRRPSGGVTIRSRVSNTCLWSRYGSSRSLCTNAPKTTRIPTAKVTTVTAQNPWFQIKNTAYNKCFALRDKSKFRRPAPTFTLDTCDQNSARQLWQWTSDGQLKLNYNGNCLSYHWLKSIHFQPCTASNRRQQWSCVGNKLKLRSSGRYLMSFMYSGLPFGYNVMTVSYCAYGSCNWSRFGTTMSVCENGKATTTTSPLTTEMVSRQPSSTTTASTTNKPATTAIPSATQPPLPPTDDIGTPPLPPTGTPPVPPFPGNTPPVVTTTKPPRPRENKKVKCGTKGRIGGVVNGTRAAAGSWPWQVGIKKCAHCNITCGGTLINDEWVVTAAHCVSGWFPNELHIVIGEVDQSVKSGHEQRFRCTKIIVHEDYGVDAPFDKDIALIRLDKYAVYNDNVRPLCMPENGTVLTKKDLCTVTGFGRVAQNGVKSAKLLQANVKIVDFKTCVKSYANQLTPRKVTSNMLCAGYKKGGTDACQGDSGGPLTCFDRSNSRFILGGVVSWGVGCAQPDLYGVYTNTALFTPWVQKKLAAFGY